MHIIYKITYIPHLESAYPKFYIGSKLNYKGNYFGSLHSKQIFEYTDNQPLALWWKTRDKNDFLFEILYQTENHITAEQLCEIELQYQKHYNIRNGDYFNQAFANGKFVSKKRSKETKQLLAERTKQFWQTENGKRKKLRLIDYNKSTKSAEMAERWKNDIQFRERSILRARQKKSTIHKQKIGEGNKKRIEYNGKQYVGYQHLKQETGITSHLYRKYYLNGIAPSQYTNNKTIVRQK